VSHLNYTEDVRHQVNKLCKNSEGSCSFDDSLERKKILLSNLEIMPRSESFYRSIARNGNWKHDGISPNEETIIDKNILNFKFPGFENPINIKFPISYLLQVCEDCHLKKRTKATCRVRLSHKSAPWSPLFLCLVFDKTCLDKNNNLMDKPFSAKILPDEYHEIFSSAEVLSDVFPVCHTCRRHSLTRHNCRTEALHRNLPWCTVFISVTALSISDDKNQAINATSLDEFSSSGNISVKSCTMDTSNKHIYSDFNVGSCVTRPEFSDRANTEGQKLKSFLVAVSGRTCTTIKVEVKRQESSHISNALNTTHEELHCTSSNGENIQIGIRNNDPRMNHLLSQDYQNSGTAALLNPDISQFSLQNEIAQLRNIQSDYMLRDNHYLSSQVPNYLLDPTQDIMRRYYLQERTLGNAGLPMYLPQGGLGSLESSVSRMNYSLPEHVNLGIDRDDLMQTLPRTYNLALSDHLPHTDTSNTRDVGPP